MLVLMIWATSSATMIARTHQVDMGLKKLLGKVECTTPASKKFQASKKEKMNMQMAEKIYERILDMGRQDRQCDGDALEGHERI